MFNSSHLNIQKQSKVKRTRFSIEEDIHLTELVKEYGANDWKIISCLMKTRTSRQCKDRWEGFLSPSIAKRAWSQEENLLLIQKISEIGKRWIFLAKFFFKIEVILI
jgi:hypothetical protein